MYCMFNVVNLCKIVEDASLGWFCMCQMDYQANEKVSTYLAKVNSIILIGERCIKDPKRVQEVIPLREAYSKTMKNSTIETCEASGGTHYKRLF